MPDAPAPIPAPPFKRATVRSIVTLPSAAAIMPSCGLPSTTMSSMSKSPSTIRPVAVESGEVTVRPRSVRSPGKGGPMPLIRPTPVPGPPVAPGSMVTPESVGWPLPSRASIVNGPGVPVMADPIVDRSTASA